MENILDVKNINIAFDKGTPEEKIIVQNGAFSVAPGELVLIIGDNGAGKSTIFNSLIFALNESDVSFEMTFNGKTISKDEKNYFRTAIGYSEQAVYDGGFFTPRVKDFVFEYASKAENNEGYEDYYDRVLYNNFRVDLYCGGKFNERRISNCSGGEKQMISILKAFSRNNANLYILDEPLNNLDAVHARLLNNFIIDLKNRPNPPGILIVTHCQMFQNVDKAYKLKNGKIELLNNYEPKSCFGECNECGKYKEE